jgi:mannan endo-1,4-beta-mannosidase
MYIKCYKLTIALLLFFLTFSCKKNSVKSVNAASVYSISGSKIYHSSNPVQLIGANAFHVFGAGGSDMNSWQIDIAREFVGNVKETPLSGGAIKDSNGSYLYSLQTVVDSNRKNNRITIICPFGWDGTNATLFTGTRPTVTDWWGSFKPVLAQWGAYFKDQPDVWIEVWNEPYIYNRTDGYTDAIWLSDMNTLVSIIRNTGNNNIVLVPCAEQGQDESVLIANGNSFLSEKTNVLFDIHAYEKWLLDADGNIGIRLGQLQQKNLPIIFGETAPINAGTLMNPRNFLDSVYNRGISVCAWVWKNSDTDQDALLNPAGNPNNVNNNNWGSFYKSFAGRARNP